MQPDVRPIAVIRLTLHLDVQPRRPCVFGKENRGIHRPVKGRIRGGQRYIKAFKPRLFQVVLRPLRIIGDLLKVVVVIGHRARDRLVVAHGAIAAQNLFDHVLAVDAVFQRHPHVHVVKRGRVGLHRHDVMQRAVLGVDLHVGRAAQQVDRLEVGPVDQVNLTGHQRVHPRRRVADFQDHNLFEMRPALFPVVIAARQFDPHARLENVDHIAAGADAAVGVDRAITGVLANAEVVIIENKREIRVPCSQFKDHNLVAIGADVGDLL